MRYNGEVENTEEESAEKNETKERPDYYEDAYHLKPNESYESEGYRYRTDDHGRIKSCEGTLRLEEGKRNLDHQRKVGGEDRRETDDGGHVIASRFGGSGKIDNLVPMDSELNRGKYKAMENEMASEVEKGNTVDMKVRMKYEGDSERPSEIIVASRVTEPDGRSRVKNYRFKNEDGE